VSETIVIGTRGSALALWQANHVKDTLAAANPGLTVSLEIIKTQGDKILDVPLAKIGGKALFVKEIEDALLERRVDLTVHSIKDMPADLPDSLVLAAFSTHEDPRDAWCARDGRSMLRDLPAGARIGTSSLRRTAQLRAMRADCEILPLRGNVDTRLRKLDDGEYDAVVLAAAGLRRLGLGARITHAFEPVNMLPAIAQGVLGLETREDDARAQSLVQVLHDADSALCVTAERAFLKKLGGGCQVPIAGHATLSRDAVTRARELRLDGLVAWPESGVAVRDAVMGAPEDAVALGEALAEKLLSRGAGEILRALDDRAAPGAP